MSQIGLEMASLRSFSVTLSVVPFQRWEKDGNGNYIYTGLNQYTGDTSDLRWIITKTFYDASNDPTHTETVQGSNRSAGASWDNRATYF